MPASAVRSGASLPEVRSEIGSGFKLGQIDLDRGMRVEPGADAGLPDERQGRMGSRGDVREVTGIVRPPVRLSAQQPANRRYRQLLVDRGQCAIGPQRYPGDSVAQRLQEQPVDDLR